RLAEEEERLVEERALRLALHEAREGAFRARGIAGLEHREAGFVERAVARGIRGVLGRELVEREGARRVALLEPRFAEEERGLGHARVVGFRAGGALELVVGVVDALLGEIEVDALHGERAEEEGIREPELLGARRERVEDPDRVRRATGLPQRLDRRAR